MFRQTLIVAGLILGLPQAACAAEWVEIGSSSDGSVYHVDRSSIVQEAEFITFWTKIDKSSIKSTQELTVKVRQQLDCQNRTLSSLYRTVVLKNGKLIVDNVDGVHNPIVPDTMGDLEFRVLCETSKKSENIK